MGNALIRPLRRNLGVQRKEDHSRSWVLTAATSHPLTFLPEYVRCGERPVYLQILRRNAPENRPPLVRRPRTGRGGWTGIRKIQSEINTLLIAG